MGWDLWLEIDRTIFSLWEYQKYVDIFNHIQFSVASDYKQLLEENVLPQLEETGNMDTLWWQQDGAPPHYAKCVREMLHSRFGERWIGRGGPVEWPPRSPDLSPLDFFLWGYLKRRVYRNRPTSLQDLKENITEECSRIPSETLEKVVSNCYRRMLRCKENNGGHFEHLLQYVVHENKFIVVPIFCLVSRHVNFW